MESGHIEDTQLSSSLLKSTLTEHYPPFLARVGNRTVGFDFQKPCLYTKTAGDWFQVDFILTVKLYGIVIAKSHSCSGYLKTYSLGLGMNVEDLDTKLKNPDDSTRYAEGSDIQGHEIIDTLDPPTEVRYARIYTQTVEGAGGSVFEFYGEITGKITKNT